jgi:hypothetical protein
MGSKSSGLYNVSQSQWCQVPTLECWICIECHGELFQLTFLTTVSSRLICGGGADRHDRLGARNGRVLRESLVIGIDDGIRRVVDA